MKLLMSRLTAPAHAVVCTLLVALTLPVLVTLEASLAKAAPPSAGLTVDPPEVVHWTPAGATQVEKDLVEVAFRLSTSRGFALYEDRIKFAPPFGFEEVARTAPVGTVKPDPISGEPAKLIEGGEFSLRFRGPVATLGGKVQTSVTYTACAEGVCLFPYTGKFEIPLTMLAPGTAEAAILPSGTVGTPAVEPALEASGEVSKEPAGSVDFETGLARKLKSGTLTLWALLAIVFIGGLLTNLTPCVAPMIPITIRILGGHDSHGLRNSSLYAAGILVTYTIAGVAAGLSGGLFGSILANAQFNLFFAAVMGILGLTMLGYGNFAALQTLGTRFGTGKPSALNMFLMGAGAGLVASPCTGPILAALLAYTAKSGSFAEAVSLIATYSLGFSLPYVVLGSAAARVTKVRVNYRLQLVTKLVFASVMFALALYYLRVPAYGLLQSIKPYFDTLTYIFAPVGIAMVLVWIAVPALHNSKAASLPPAAALAIAIFSASQLYLAGPSAAGSIATQDALKWHKEEVAAFTEARISGKPLLVDAWAEWCDACKKMDVTTFADPAVIAELKSGWILLKLDLTEGSDANDALQDKYGLQSLPTLTMVGPDGDLEKKEAISGYTPAETLLELTRQFKKQSAGQAP
ncbi:MAG: hypothetical protein RIQ81_2133 [Pseudomonadota bacterium]|jgi:thiol:disulfide interchange protein DsbD